MNGRNARSDHLLGRPPGLADALQGAQDREVGIAARDLRVLARAKQRNERKCQRKQQHHAGNKPKNQHRERAFRVKWKREL